MIKTKAIISILLWLCYMPLQAGVQQTSPTMEKLKEEMHQLFTKSDKEKFMQVTEQLKKECQAVDNDELFYKTWANQVMYDANKGELEFAIEEAKRMKHYALDRNEKYGIYAAVHAMAQVYYRMKDYRSAESMYLESIDYLHEHFPEHGASAAYVELAKIAYYRSEYDKMERYSLLALEEKDCEPSHQLRALSYLCELMEARNDVKSFDKYYKMRKEVLKLTPPSVLASEVELSNLILHGKYKKALEEAKKLESPSREARLAQINHLLGHDSVAYLLMRKSKQKSDSLNKAVSVDLLEEYVEEIGKERKENMQFRQKNLELLKRINTMLWVLAVVIIAAMGYTVYRRWQLIKHLREKNEQLLEAQMKEHRAMMAEHEAKEKEHRARMAEHEARMAEHEALQKEQESRLAEHEARLAEHEALQKEQTARLAEHEARREAERALQVKREFLNNVSHEMRTPLNAISGFTQLITTPGLEVDDAMMDELRSRITENTNLLTEIVDNMITLSYYDSKSSLECDDMVSPSSIVEQLVQMYAPQVREGVELKMDLQVPVDYFVATNSQALQKALGHLIANAIKFTGKGSVSVSVTGEDGHATFAVADTGPGVPEEKKAGLFDLFSETGEDVKTTGMGLNICRAVARLLGGRAYYDPEYTGGSRFVFEI